MTGTNFRCSAIRATIMKKIYDVWFNQMSIFVYHLLLFDFHKRMRRMSSLICYFSLSSLNSLILLGSNNQTTIKVFILIILIIMLISTSFKLKILNVKDLNQHD